MKHITSPYHDMPGEILTRDVRAKAQQIVDGDPRDIYARGAGYFLRIYASLFNGNAPLNDKLAFERLPEVSRDALCKVASACLETLALSEQLDKYPIGPSMITTHVGEDGEETLSVSEVIRCAQLGFEMVQEPGPVMRRHMEENELEIALGLITAHDAPVCRSYGLSLITKESVGSTIRTAGEEFGAVFGGLELVIEDEQQRDRTVHYIATIVGSSWRHPGWVEPPHQDFL